MFCSGKFTTVYPRVHDASVIFTTTTTTTTRPIIITVNRKSGSQRGLIDLCWLQRGLNYLTRSLVQNVRLWMGQEASWTLLTAYLNCGCMSNIVGITEKPK